MAVATLARRHRLRAGTWHPSRMWASYTQDLNAAAIWAGITTFIWYAVGLLPVQIAVTSHFGLTTPQISSWIFIIWFSGSLASIALSLIYRQPIPITSSIPGLLFLGTVANRFSFPELMGANLMAGVVIMALGVLGVGGRVLAWLPMPIAMGMLAGSILADVSNMVQATVADSLVAGATVVGYVVGRVVRQPRVPPIALALVAGAVVSVVSHSLAPGSIDWQLPSLVSAEMVFTPSAFMAVSIPLVVLSMGLGNVQGLGFLAAQGYRVPVSATTVMLGFNSVVNALLGGHVAIVSRSGMPIMAGSEAGPQHGRYWANLISAGLCLSIALAAGPVASLLAILPRAFIVALMGLAILPSFQNALERAFGDNLRFGAMIAMVVAATPFTLLGVTSAFWSLVAALGVSYLMERDELVAFWGSFTNGVRGHHPGRSHPQ
jgi:benzoate membrane transport protein